MLSDMPTPIPTKQKHFYQAANSSDSTELLLSIVTKLKITKILYIF